MMGLGSIVGTGVFVSIAIATDVAGTAVILAILLAAGVAICNGLSSAQLAASHPTSGGTYEYGYRYLKPWLGFTAGWVFLLAKAASAATAALGFSGYLLSALGVSYDYLIPAALAPVALFTLVVLLGIRSSNIVNIVIVSVALLSLIFFVIAGLPTVSLDNLAPFPADAPDERGFASALFYATALMFVAFAGYARIATLGEEVRDPRRTIPRAIILTMLVTMALYVTVAIVGIGAVGVADFSQAADTAGQTQVAPLAIAAQQFAIPFSGQILAIGAIAAMLGVLLNLILGLSRVLLAMGRRGDMPAPLAWLNEAGTTPYWSVVVVGLATAGLVLIGDVKTTWSFSAFTVLIYYAITNLAALRIPAEQRLYPAWVAILGLIACVFLAFWVEWQTWLSGLALIAVGLVWHAVARMILPRTTR